MFIEKETIPQQFSFFTLIFTSETSLKYLQNWSEKTAEKKNKKQINKQKERQINEEQVG